MSAVLRRLSAHARVLRDRPQNQLPVLDVLRTAAVLLVVIGHVAGWWTAATQKEIPLASSAVFQYGWTGVDLFFVLSGYLIGGQLWREANRTGGIKIGQFILRRGFRIWPLYFAFAFMVPLVKGVAPRLSDLLFVSNYIPGLVEGGWSLSSEEQFYVLMPCLIALSVQKFTLRAWVGAIIVAFVAVAASRYFAAAELLTAGVDRLEVKRQLVWPFHLHCEAMLMGALIALVELLFPAALHRPSGHVRVLQFVGVGVSLIVLAIALHLLNNIVFPFLALALLFGVATWAMLVARDTTFFAKLGVNSKIFYTSSKLSYGVYLWHFYVLDVVVEFFKNAIPNAYHGSTAVFLLVLVVATLASFGSAAVTFVAIEQPFLELRERVLRSGHHSRQPTAHATPPSPR